MLVYPYILMIGYHVLFLEMILDGNVCCYKVQYTVVIILWHFNS